MPLLMRLASASCFPAASQFSVSPISVVTAVTGAQPACFCLFMFTSKGLCMLTSKGLG